MLPIVLQNLMLALVAVADAFMLGGMDQNYMSAVSLATQIQFIQNMFLSAATASLGILGAQYWGKGDVKTLDEIFCMALRLCGLVSVVFFVACAFGGRYLMLIFTNESVLIDYGVNYLRIAGFSYLLTGISQCYLVIMKVSEHARTTAAISSATVCINIILNAVFIYGAFGLEAMGVRGAALATLIARIIELTCAVAVSYRKGYIHPQMKFLFRRNKQLSKDFSKCAMPLLGACLFWGIGFTSYSSFMGHLGVDAAAANSVAAVVRDVVCCLSAGISGAAGIMVGNELGAGNLERGKEYGIRLLKISCFCGIVAALLMCVAAPVVLHFVKLTPQAISYLKGMFAVIAFYMIGRAINDVTINGIFGAGGDTLFDMYSLAVCMWCLAIPLAAAGTYYFHWPVVVVYACTCIDEVGKLPWVLHHFRKYKWVKDLTR
ncbi:MATE family efflux transporter [Blautia sp. MSJ-19]|uniref:MATE family efflux transporter n=1 Tax=Blautia sp. MSJ-19 TaxID=2841517 RepID=UPI001C0F33D7|nr:MATE family efflux transporter [Blautia sp. MSJ-19]MBU5482500.1 MATE family efflux transporter [Blautia sp. MSJ-19]